jgi:hypothetical protein
MKVLEEESDSALRHIKRLNFVSFLKENWASSWKLELEVRR